MRRAATAQRSRCRRRRVRSAGALALAVVVVTLLAVSLSPLGGFETLGRWPLPRLSFMVNANFPDEALAGTPEEQTEIVRCAARTWETQTRADIELRFLGNTNIDRVRDDGVNAIFWTDRDGRGALAATQLATDVETGTIRSFDIIFYSETNGSPVRWSGPGEPPPGTFDIGGVATHELGHALGLEHSGVPAATMFASAAARALGLRTLDDDDREGIEFLYGVAGVSLPQVELTAVEPDFGSPEGGEEVILSGVNFTYDSETQIRIDGMTVDTSRWRVESCGVIVISSMPPHASGAVDITVANSIGTATLAGAYRYGSPAPQIFAIEPAVGPLDGGIAVTVTGERFSDSAVVRIDGKPLEDPLLVDVSTLVGTLPAGDRPGFVDVELSQDGETFVLAGGFFYNGYTLALATIAAPPGSDAVPVGVLATTPDPLGAISFGLRYDPSLVTLDNITVEGTLARDAEFARASLDNAGGVATFGLVMSFSNALELPAGDDLLTARILANTAPGAPIGTTAALELAGDVGSPPVRMIFTPAGTADEITPETRNGAIRITQGVAFLRGDANDDGMVNIADALSVLGVLFQSEAAPHCEKALDANDDGSLNIADAVRILEFLFASGLILPPPHPERGLDPTPDDLTCE